MVWLQCIVFINLGSVDGFGAIHCLRYSMIPQLMRIFTESKHIYFDAIRNYLKVIAILY